MDIILTYTDMIVYIYGKWIFMWRGGGDCFSKWVYIPDWVGVVWTRQLLSLDVVFILLVKSQIVCEMRKIED